MSTVETLVVLGARAALVGLFGALGVIALGLIGLAVLFPANILERLLVFVLGVGGVVIAAGALPLVSGLSDGQPSA